jgi:prophage tail gpP-like protein
MTDIDSATGLYTGPPPDPKEVATIITREMTALDTNVFQASGQSGVFTDWKQVYVQIRMFDPYGVFRFLAVERDPMPTLWNRLQFIPGDEVAIYLGGDLAIAGNIDMRQTAYDANQHGVMLQGKSYSDWASKSAVMKTSTTPAPPDADIANFDNMSFQEVVETLLPRYGVQFYFQGRLDSTPFKRLQAETGENVFNFLERLARVRGIVIGSDQQGAMTFTGEQDAETSISLIEGVNILSMQAIWSTDLFHNPVGVFGSTAGGDDKSGTDASEQQAWSKGLASRFAPHITAAEQPVWNLAELQARARNEARWLNSDMLTANITVQGWFRSDGRLWRPNDLVYVRSPMAMLDDTLGVQGVTYQQDSAAGSTTTLECVVPWKLGYNTTGAFAPTDQQQPQQPSTQLQDPNDPTNPMTHPMMMPPVARPPRPAPNRIRLVF